MTLSIDGKVFKKFRAVCPKTRRQHAQVFSRATSGVAKAFLAEALKRLGDQPLQVDGGSEFRGDFEDECAERKLPLKVLPPRRPELNGIVERANRTARIECWSLHVGELNCQAMNAALERHLDYYNNRRPHRSLDMRTPAQQGYDAGHGRLTENVRKVSDPAQCPKSIVWLAVAATNSGVWRKAKGLLQRRTIMRSRDHPAHQRPVPPARPPYDRAAGGFRLCTYAPCRSGGL